MREGAKVWHVGVPEGRASACTGGELSGKVGGGSGVDSVLVRYISDVPPIHLRYTSDIHVGFR